MNLKSLALLLGLLLVIKSSVFGIVDLGSATSRTPYDLYMRPVKTVFSAIHEQSPTMPRVEALMREGRAFRYAHTEPYYPALPEETAARRVGDCKDKALWLCDQLQDPSARFVIGKLRRDRRISHAWVMWENEGRWWILDCTMTGRPIPADRVGRDEYVPLYSFSKGVAFHHTGTNDALADVAARMKAPVASKGERKTAAKSKKAPFTISSTGQIAAN